MGIRLMGIEYEGGWNGERGVAPFNDASIKYDGSVSLHDVTHYGEVCSEPLEVPSLIDWAKSHVPHVVNRSCGTHVHMSFDKRTEYAVCVNKKYMDGLYDLLETVATSHALRSPAFSSQLAQRLRGNNTYCHKRFNPVRQLQDTVRDSSRYAGVNYCHKLHGTIEIRVLPGIADAGIAEEVLTKIITFTEQFIQNNAHKKRIRFRR